MMSIPSAGLCKAGWVAVSFQRQILRAGRVHLLGYLRFLSIRASQIQLEDNAVIGTSCVLPLFWSLTCQSMEYH